MKIQQKWNVDTIYTTIFQLITEIYRNSSMEVRTTTRQIRRIVRDCWVMQLWWSSMVTTIVNGQLMVTSMNIHDKLSSSGGHNADSMTYQHKASTENCHSHKCHPRVWSAWITCMVRGHAHINRCTVQLPTVCSSRGWAPSYGWTWKSHSPRCLGIPKPKLDLVNFYRKIWPLVRQRERERDFVNCVHLVAPVSPEKWLVRLALAFNGVVIGVKGVQCTRAHRCGRPDEPCVGKRKAFWNPCTWARFNLATPLLALSVKQWQQPKRLTPNQQELQFEMNVTRFLSANNQRTHNNADAVDSDLHETPKLSASVKYSLTKPLHCLLILPTCCAPSPDDTCRPHTSLT